MIRLRVYLIVSAGFCPVVWLLFGEKPFYNNCINGINDWNISSSANFTQMFASTPSHPEFTKVAGTWNNGTFTPTS